MLQTDARTALDTSLKDATTAKDDLARMVDVLTEERDLARSKEEEYFLELEVRGAWCPGVLCWCVATPCLWLCGVAMAQ